MARPGLNSRPRYAVWLRERTLPSLSFSPSSVQGRLHDHFQQPSGVGWKGCLPGLQGSVHMPVTMGVTGRQLTYGEGAEKLQEWEGGEGLGNPEVYTPEIHWLHSDPASPRLLCPAGNVKSLHLLPFLPSHLPPHFKPPTHPTLQSPGAIGLFLFASVSPSWDTLFSLCC